MSRIDRFVEQILSRYRLDIYERSKVETRLREFLDGFVDQGVERGLDRDRAECEAVRQFDYRSAFARLFNLPDHLFCVALTGACFAFPLVVFATFNLLFSFSDGHAGILIFCGSLALMALCAWAYLKLRTRKFLAIENGVVFRRFFRKPEHITYDQLVRIVRPPWGYTYEFRYEGGRRFVPTISQTRLEMVVLGALAEGVIGPEVENELRKLRSVLRPETLTLRIAGSIAWLTLICIYIAGGLRLMWAGDGYPWPVAIVLACSPFVALAQTFRIPHRPRAVFINVIGFAQTVPFFLLYYGAVLNGDTFQLRQWALFTGLCFAMALIATWWRGSIKPLIALAICMAIFFFGVRESIRPRYFADQIVLSSFSPSFPTWIDNGQTATWFEAGYNEATDRFENYLTISRNGASPKKFLLSPDRNGPYRHYPPPPGKRIAIFHEAWRNQQSFYFNFLNADDSLETMTLPFRATDSRWDDNSWSPDGRYFCAGTAYYGDARTTLSCFDTQTGRRVDTSYFDGRGRFTWTGPHTLKLCRVSTDSITVRQIDLHTTRVETLHRYPYERYKYRPYVLPGSRYACMWTYLLDLDTGQRMHLPFTQADDIGPRDWEPNAERLAYLANGTESRRVYQTIVVYQPGRGIVARHDFESPRFINEIKLSPDGEHVFIFSRTPDPRLYQGEWGQFTHTIGCTIAHREVLNLKTHEILRLNSCDGLLPWNSDDVAWSPDSRKLLYQPCNPIPWIIDYKSAVVLVQLK